MIPAFVALVVVAFGLPAVSAPEYSILRDTTSGLGAQGAPWAWVMNTVFAPLGLGVLWDGRPRMPDGFRFYRVALAGALLILAIPAFAGVRQRGMMFVSFGWLILLFRDVDRKITADGRLRRTG